MATAVATLLVAALLTAQWGSNAAGLEWKHRYPPARHPLYGLDGLLAHRLRPGYISQDESEVAVDLARLALETWDKYRAHLQGTLQSDDGHPSDDAGGEATDDDDGLGMDVTDAAGSPEQGESSEMITGEWKADGDSNNKDSGSDGYSESDGYSNSDGYYDKSPPWNDRFLDEKRSFNQHVKEEYNKPHYCDVCHIACEEGGKVKQCYSCQMDTVCAPDETGRYCVASYKPHH